MILRKSTSILLVCSFLFGCLSHDGVKRGLWRADVDGVFYSNSRDVDDCVIKLNDSFESPVGFSGRFNATILWGRDSVSTFSFKLICGDVVLLERQGFSGSNIEVFEIDSVISMNIKSSIPVYQKY